jgi:hypothetical protein
VRLCMSTKESDVLFGDQLSGLDVSQHLPPPLTLSYSTSRL